VGSDVVRPLPQPNDRTIGVAAFGKEIQGQEDQQGNKRNNIDNGEPGDLYQFSLHYSLTGKPRAIQISDIDLRSPHAERRLPGRALGQDVVPAQKR